MSDTKRMLENSVKILARIVVVIALSLTSGLAAGQAAAQLGAPAFNPSPEHPIGWRGDWTGRFPGATPPAHWGRWINSFVTDLRCQGAKPAGDAEGGVPLDLGAPQDWLVIGPYPVKELTKDLVEEPVENEAQLVAEEGKKVGQIAWQPAKVNIATQCHDYARLALDFAFIYQLKEQTEWQNHSGKLEPLIGYAHSYIYAKESGKARFYFQADGFAKCWLNGKPVVAGEVDLLKGWNRVLAKVGSSKRAWHFNCRFDPIGPYEYLTKNVTWMTHMPGESWSSPIVVGDRIFVSAGYCDLVCLSKADGKIQWVRSITYYDALTDEQRKQTPGLVETVGPMAAQVKAMTDEIVAEINSHLGSGGIPYARQAALSDKIRKKNELSIKIHREMGKLDRKAFPNPDQHTGSAHATPCSDGKSVWAAMLGGCKGIGGNTLACFDLEGNKKWSFYTGPIGAPEHGNHASPLLIGDKLIYSAMQSTFAFEKDTGKRLWEYKVNHWGYAGASPLKCRSGDTDVVIDPCGEIIRLSDGKGLWTNWQLGGYAFNSGVVADDTYYQSTMWTPIAYAMKLPSPAGDKLTPEMLFKVTGKEIHCPEINTTNGNAHVASVLFDAGLMYLVTEGGGLSVLDGATGKKVYSKVLELTPRLIWVYTVGVCSSPTLAGKNIYITDDQAQTIIFEPGKEYKQVGQNVLVNFVQDQRPQQEQSQSSPFFEGRRMYYRSGNYLYCIEEK